MKQWTLMRCLAAAGVLVAGLIMLVLMSMDVSAVAQPTWIERNVANAWFSLKVRLTPARKTSPPFDTNDLQHALELYQRNCSFCHGGPEGKPAAFAESLSPRPPQFFRDGYANPAWRAAYIIRHGVRWTGMPAFTRLADDDAWRIATMLTTKSKKQMGEEAH